MAHQALFALAALAAILVALGGTAIIIALLSDAKSVNAENGDATLNLQVTVLQTRVDNLINVVDALIGTVHYASPGTYTNGQLLIGDTATGNLSLNTLTGIDGVTIANGPGTITVGLLQPTVQTYASPGPITSFPVPVVSGITAVRVCAALSGGGGSGSGGGVGAGGSGGGSGAYVYNYCVSLAGVSTISGTVGAGGALANGSYLVGNNGFPSQVIITAQNTVSAYGGGGAAGSQFFPVGGAGGGCNSGAATVTPGTGLASSPNGGISGASGGVGGADSTVTPPASGGQAASCVAGAGGGYGQTSGGAGGSAGAVLYTGGYAGGTPGSIVNLGTGGGAAGIGGAGGNGASTTDSGVGYAGQGCGAGGGGSSLATAASGAGFAGCVTLTFYYY
jgi:hypothetical protein